MQHPLIWAALGMGISALAQADVALPPAGATVADGKPVLRTATRLMRDAYPRAPTNIAPVVPPSPLRLRLSVELSAPQAVAAGGEGLRPALQPTLRSVAFTPAALPEQSGAVSALIQQAQFWSSQGRDDLAGEAVSKLFRIAPDNLQGLEVLARIQVRQRQPQAVRPILERMRRLQPGAIEIRRTEALLRVDGDDREALQAIRQLVRENRNAEAASAMRSLYPDGAPTEDMTLEYWRMVANSPNGTARARAGLREAARQEPGNLRYRLALAEMLTARAPVDQPALAQIIALTQVPALSKQARAAWRRAMLVLDESAGSVSLLRTYLLQEKNDTAVQARLDSMTGGARGRGPQPAEPIYQAQRSRAERLAGPGPDSPATPERRPGAARDADTERVRQAAARRATGFASNGVNAANTGNAGNSTTVAAAAQASAQITDAERASLLRTQADTLVAGGNAAAAIDLLEQAAPLAPDDPWLRFDLARLYGQRNGAGDSERADQLFAALLTREKTDPSALYAFALVNDSRDRPLAALTTLERMTVDAREPKIVQLQRRLWVSLHLRQAEVLQSGGQPDAARQAVRQVATAIGNDPLLAPQVAAALAAQGGADDVAAANALLDRTQTSQPLPADWLIERAEFAARFGDDAAFAAALQKAEAMPVMAAPAAADSARLPDLRARLVARRVDTLLRQGDNAGALTLIERESPAFPANRRLQLLHADTALAAGRPREAEARYRRLLALEPENFDAGIGLIDTLIAAGGIDAARQQIALLRAQRSARQGGMSNDDIASLAARLIDLKEDDEAAALIEPALAASPDNVRLLNQAAGIAERGNRPQQAISYLQRGLGITAAARTGDVLAAQSRINVQSLQPSQQSGLAPDIPGSTPLIETGTPPTLPADGSYRRLAELLDARSTWVAGAIDVRSRAGAQGRSEFSYSELPMELRMPWRDGSRVFMQTSVVRSGAGSVDLATTDDAARFGSLLLCQPLCTGAGGSQNVTGLGLAAGIERGPVRADIGVTPLGFPIRNLVGGLLAKGDLGAYSYSVDVSRRAVTGSVLSYAGTRDPRSGERWGGVLANGVRFGLSRDAGGTFGAWSSLGLHRLTGTNVQSNDRIQLMGGSYWRLINEDDRLLTVGVNAMHWRFSENAGEYTLGHGGYYSPRRFNSVSLPVSFGQRTARLSYVLRAALSASRSSTSEAAYFPTRPDLQTQALALAAAGGIDPRYGASTGRGVGRSLSASFEYQMHPKLFLGGRFEIDRSTDYAPNRLMFYFRYDLDQSSARPAVFPPEQPVPASQY